MRITRRAVVAVLLALISLAAPLAAPPAAAASTGVTWSIDHTNKVIKAKVKITLTPVCTTNQRMMEAIARTRICQVPQKAADDMKAAIEAIWNNKNKYYCYDIKVEVDITIDNNPSGDPADRLRVQVEQSPVPIRSFVRHYRPSSGSTTGTGSAPADQIEAGNFGSSSSTWSYPPRSPQTYAHEAGHVLGLDDGYEDVKDANGKVVGSRIRSGHADDLMSNNTQRRHLDKTTLRRMVERQGYTKGDLKCNYLIDVTGNGAHIYGFQCDPEGGLWTANGVYQKAGATGDQTWTLMVNWTTKRGTYDYADNQEMETLVPGIKTLLEGIASGDVTVTIDAELRARMQLRELAHSYHVSVPGVPGAWGNDQNAPLASTEMVWEPIGLPCPPP